MENLQNVKKPKATFRAGSISAAIWSNDNGKGEYFTITLKRDYKENNEWKSTSSLRINDLPKARIVLEKAYEFVVMNREVSA